MFQYKGYKIWIQTENKELTRKQTSLVWSNVVYHRKPEKIRPCFPYALHVLRHGRMFRSFCSEKKPVLLLCMQKTESLTAVQTNGKTWKELMFSLCLASSAPFKHPHQQRCSVRPAPEKSAQTPRCDCRLPVKFIFVLTVKGNPGCCPWWRNKLRSKRENNTEEYCGSGRNNVIWSRMTLPFRGAKWTACFVAVSDREPWRPWSTCKDYVLQQHPWIAHAGQLTNRRNELVDKLHPKRSGFVDWFQSTTPTPSPLDLSQDWCDGGGSLACVVWWIGYLYALLFCFSWVTPCFWWQIFPVQTRPLHACVGAIGQNLVVLRATCGCWDYWSNKAYLGCTLCAQGLSQPRVSLPAGHAVPSVPHNHTRSAC